MTDLTNFVPGEIEMLIHYYCVEEHWSQLNESRAGSNWIGRALRDGLLTRSTELSSVKIPRASSYAATPKLARLVQAWCETPMPEQKWVMPE